jgi:transcriptional regulator with XRE-family HTH domain
MQQLSLASARHPGFMVLDMADNDTRRTRLAWLRDNEFGGYAKALSDRLERSPSQLGQWLTGHRSISADTARMIEERCGYPKYWLDGDVPGNAPEPSPMAQRLSREFDKLPQAAQSALFVQIMEQIERATIAPVPDAAQPVQRPKIRRRLHQ